MGNPLCDDEQYMLFVVAHLPDLMYLDFRLVSDTTVSISAFPACEIGQQHRTRAFALLVCQQYSSIQGRFPAEIRLTETHSVYSAST